ncbi:MAG: sensor histidine kinase [Candidatus Dormibacteraceae bacterium]
MVHALLVRATGLYVLQIAGTVMTFTFANWVTTAVMFSFDTGEGAVAIWRRNFSVSWLAAFLYFALSAIVISGLLDGSVRGYVMALIVFALSFALTDTIAGRRSLSMYAEQLADADRHLVYSRTLEGVGHNLRNHLQNVQGALDDIDTSGLADAARSMLDLAKAAVADAAGALRSIASGTSPRVSFAREPLDLNRLTATSVALGQAMARRGHVQLTAQLSKSALVFRGDPLLLREVASNLIINALEAAAVGGRVTVTTGHRTLTTVFLTVADSGPGIAPQLRDRLFEPHFTTKAAGTGMGLFTSYGIMKEHHGELLYEGSRRRGGIFTMVLPAAA